MSAYSDWKCGALSDDDYTAECNREAAMDRYLEELVRGWRDQLRLLSYH